ncbi:MAG: chorismate synthase [Burkholderiales bacterium]
MSVWGRSITVDIFGESHGEAIGVVLSGLKPGFKLDIEKIQAMLDRRKAGGETWSTKRGEADRFNIVSGVLNGRTTGAPLCALCENKNARSGDYPEGLNRPGHADYTAYARYGGFNDARGGGAFSGRLTAPLVFAGAVAAQMLEEKGVYAAAHIKRLAGVDDEAFDQTNITRELADALKSSRFPLIDVSKQHEMESRIAQAAAEGDSVGGVVECAVCGLPAGLGAEYFGSVESALSSILFAIPAVKGVSFGAGASIADMRGSEANDEYIIRDGNIAAVTNNNGGILGGITNGMPVVFDVVIKPTPSIAKPQCTVNLKTMEPETIEIKGRHDPCIVPRAVPVVEAAALLAILDIMAGGL